MIRFSSILTVLSASLYLACGSAEASQLSSQLQKKDSDSAKGAQHKRRTT